MSKRHQPFSKIIITIPSNENLNIIHMIDTSINYYAFKKRKKNDYSYKNKSKSISIKKKQKKNNIKKSN